MARKLLLKIDMSNRLAVLANLLVFAGCAADVSPDEPQAGELSADLLPTGNNPAPSRSTRRPLHLKTRLGDAVSDRTVTTVTPKTPGRELR